MPAVVPPFMSCETLVYSFCKAGVGLTASVVTFKSQILCFLQEDTVRISLSFQSTLPKKMILCGLYKS
jgi:hypothetical protein